MSSAIVTGSFDDLRSRDVRFLQEATQCGPLHVLLWSDAVLKSLGYTAPKFPHEERLYFLDSIRYVDRVTLLEGVSDQNSLPANLIAPGCTWVVNESQADPAQEEFCRERKLEYCVIRAGQLQGFPASEWSDSGDSSSTRKKVLVTGCYDWLHTGHVRFFEEVSQFGELYVVLGHDANIRYLKGDGHPLYGERERRFMVGSIRFVKQALISSGEGWLDAEPEIERIRPDIYAVNEDGDRPEKSDYCRTHDIEYLVLKRQPKPGLPTRQSTDLRGF